MNNKVKGEICFWVALVLFLLDSNFVFKIVEALIHFPGKILAEVLKNGFSFEYILGLMYLAVTKGWKLIAFYLLLLFLFKTARTISKWIIIAFLALLFFSFPWTFWRKWIGFDEKLSTWLMGIELFVIFWCCGCEVAVILLKKIGKDVSCGVLQWLDILPLIPIIAYAGFYEGGFWFYFINTGMICVLFNGYILFGYYCVATLIKKEIAARRTTP